MNHMPKLTKRNLNSIKPHLGRHINLHLKDGSVMVNVHLTKAEANKGRSIIQIAKSKGKTVDISINEVDWIQPLNPWEVN